MTLGVQLCPSEWQKPTALRGEMLLQGDLLVDIQDRRKATRYLCLMLHWGPHDLAYFITRCWYGAVGMEYNLLI